MSMRGPVNKLEAALCALDDVTRARCLDFLRSILAFAGRSDVIPEPVARALMDCVTSGASTWALRGAERTRQQIREAVAHAPALLALARELGLA